MALPEIVVVSLRTKLQRSGALCMTISLLFSMLALLITGLTSHWLHYSAFASGCCSALYLLVIAAKRRIGKKRESKEARWWTMKYASLSLKKLKGSNVKMTAMTANRERVGAYGN